MTRLSTHAIRWQKSSFSGVDGEDCVELARAEAHLLLRESDAPGDVLALAPRGLLALIRHFKAEPQ
ncbi:DUF397 domain-containing protein [Streptomyces sp. NBC_00996]|uniref:DUF397 domain-containing protein n=1 Tax=Streptomyces sp. NBC_00996 TaxID=2903710 RepID=UPI003867651D|nr:DUF397 domain-containing protein [Streptomyces sp. NBC_00996]